MTKTFRSPVTIQLYLGSGKKGQKIYGNILKEKEKEQSVSDFILRIIKEANPNLFKGVEDAKNT